MRIRSIGIVTLAYAISSTSAVANTEIAIGATSTSSPFYGYFVSVANIINNQVPGVDASVVETGATIENLIRMGRGQLDMGLVTTNAAYDAFVGEGQFEERPVDARILWVYFDAPQMTLVRQDSGIHNFADLDGNSFHTGMRGSSTEATTDAIFETLGINTEVFRAGAEDSRNAVKDNRVVGWTASSMGPKLSATQIEVNTFVPLHPLSLTADEVNLIKENHPQLAILDIPPGAAEEFPEFTTWGFGLGAAASSDMDEQTAYNIVKAVIENRDSQTNAMKATGDINYIEATLNYAKSPLHPGAIKYFEEQGYEVPDNLIDAE